MLILAHGVDYEVILSVGLWKFVMEPMACSSPPLLLCYYRHPLPSEKLPKSSRFCGKPSNIWAFKTQSNVNIATCNVEEKERPKFRWTEVNPNSLTEEQKLMISRLPRKMEKRCKALMRQIICFSSEKGNLCDLLGAWARLMRPRRADWLAVLKELRNMNHPLFLEISELAISEESFEANVRDYTKMIHLYANLGRLQDAENVLAAMGRRGLTCDQVTLTTMIHMYSKAGNFKLAEETFEDMKLLGESLDKRSYGAMIMAYIRAGMPNKGEDLIKEMENQQIYAGREVYKALLRTYSMKGDAEGAQRIFYEIQVAGICPDIKLCGLLINAFVVASQSQKARVAFENMRKAGIEPSDKCVALVLTAYEKENKVNTAMDFLVNLEREGFMIGREASDVLVRWFRRLGVVEEVASILKEYAANEVSV